MQVSSGLKGRTDAAVEKNVGIKVAKDAKLSVGRPAELCYRT